MKDVQRIIVFVGALATVCITIVSVVAIVRGAEWAAAGIIIGVVCATICAIIPVTQAISLKLQGKSTNSTTLNVGITTHEREAREDAKHSTETQTDSGKPSEPADKKTEGGIVDYLFEPQLSSLIAEWRHKILAKVTQLQGSDLALAEAKARLRTYLQRLAKDRQTYVEESKQQIAELPDMLKAEHPEGGLHVALGIAGTTMRFADHIKASEALLEVLPQIIELCDDDKVTLEFLGERVCSAFEDLQFLIE